MGGGEIETLGLLDPQDGFPCKRKAVLVAFFLAFPVPWFSGHVIYMGVGPTCCITLKYIKQIGSFG